jgi:hypothetical protein
MSTSDDAATTTSRAMGDIDAVTQRVRELSEQVIDQAKKNGLAFLEEYERVLKNLLDLEEQAAKGMRQDWATTLASTHANFVRETSEVFLGVWRDQLTSGGPPAGPPSGGGKRPPPPPPDEK